MSCNWRNIFVLFKYQFVVSVEHYEKGPVEVLPDSCPLEMSDDAIHMRVHDGSKIRNLMAYAFKKIKVSV